jgi:hypothetical protein
VLSFTLKRKLLLGLNFFPLGMTIKKDILKPSVCRRTDVSKSIVRNHT